MSLGDFEDRGGGMVTWRSKGTNFQLEEEIQHGD